jgi:hypothetical protein
VFDTSRGYATGPTPLEPGDYAGMISFKNNTSTLATILTGKIGTPESSDAILALIAGGATLSLASTGPDGPFISVAAPMYAGNDAQYDLGATGCQFKDIYFSGNLYQNYVPFSGGGGGGVAGTNGQFTYNSGGTSAGSDKFVYRATGPTGPTGQATGPTGPTIQLGAHLVPTSNATYDLGATGIQFKDVFFSGNLYKNGTVFSGGGGGGGVPGGPTGALQYNDGTGFSGLGIFADVPGGNFSKLQSLADPEAATNSIDFTDGEAMTITGTVGITMSDGTYNTIGFEGGGENYMRIDATSGITLSNGDNSIGMLGNDGIILTCYNQGPGGPTSNVINLLSTENGGNSIYINSGAGNALKLESGGEFALKIGANEPEAYSVLTYQGPFGACSWQPPSGGVAGTTGQFTYNNNGISAGSDRFVYRATGPTGPTGQATGPTGPTIQLGAHLVPTSNAMYDLGATGIQFKDVFFSGNLYQNGGAYLGKLPTDNFMVAGGDAAALAYTYDGTTWAAATQNVLAECFAVAWNGALWVAGGIPAIGGMDTMAYSSDGINWYPIVQDILTSSCKAIAWNGSIWIAGGVAVYNTMAYSLDGINWTALPGASAILSTSCNAVAWNGSMWVAVGSGNDNMAYSVDGIHWNNVAGSPFSGGTCYCLAWNGTIWLAGGRKNAGLIGSSSDGITWSEISAVTALGVPYIYTIAWNGYRWLAGGDVSQATKTIITSVDGNLWNVVNQTIITESCKSIVWNGSIWVAIGTTGSASKFAKSTNGTSWTEVTYTGFQNGAYALAARRPLPYVGVNNFVNIPLSGTGVADQSVPGSNAILGYTNFGSNLFARPFTSVPIVTASMFGADSSVLPTIGTTIVVADITNTGFQVYSDELIRYRWIAMPENNPT